MTTNQHRLIIVCPVGAKLTAVVNWFHANIGPNSVPDDLGPGLSTGSKSSATLNHNGTALTDGDTVTIGSRLYLYKTVLTGAANEVLIGAATASLANLKSAVNGSAGAGTTYGLGTVPHSDVNATTSTGSTAQLFEAKVAGAAGNAIAKSETSTNLVWNAGATFIGGSDPGTPPATYRWCNGSFTDAECKAILLKLCQLASVTPPTNAQWNGWTRPEKRTWLISVRNTIWTNYSVWVTLADNEGAWDNAQAEAQSRGLVVISSGTP